MSASNQPAPASEPEEGLLAWIYESECEAYNEELYLYVVAQQNGETVTALFPTLSAHLAECPRCQALVRELQFMLEGEARAGLTLSSDPTPLAAPSMAADPSARIRQTIHQGITWVLEQGQQIVRVWVNGADLIANPPPWSGQLAAVRGALTTEPPEWQLNPNADAPTPLIAAETEIRVALLADPDDAARVTWQVTVTQPARWPDFAGVPVTLYPADGEPQRRTTGPDGMVQFTALPRQALATLQVAIELPAA